ncbi:hypothetical protein [Patulibacter minatonensis]|uniref:hypothetical protein n=1 Tax=Patulibacter minatonensis TaxID=298163 RepID=UPI00047A368D|nr:hypothetical protein [Patulibacter minatonensis]
MFVASVAGLSSEDVTVLLTLAQLVVVVVSLWYLGSQVRGERVAAGFAAYSHVNDSYMEHLWRAVEDPSLDCIWDPWHDDRVSVLNVAQRGQHWGAWRTMTVDERRCYRYTRAAIEIFEQAWEVKRRNMIGDDTWAKWHAWLTTWCNSRYFEIVLEDIRPRLIKEFAEEVDLARSERDASS